ncbi:probable DNA-directed RNA polymerase III subunit RPC6 [Drosophila hydei]|uniref:DNA-directed RNA polymerase III subunit RPC6 n=1 Tax=Drosophila hydei TaxID=7224 RepID=A0A6J1LV83_DROHY|nr:probable DNA-directed RNA polymerase III subunit RPC6 [Drosophila hydei]XP_023169338.2 probable DNA-directed RNA polymerase III subunit RPC6 [Drosophila hydei]XP_023169339.2 probable DNA-directed RNA polymerase III subunit RPC6 [Drosophila hydei]
MEAEVAQLLLAVIQGIPGGATNDDLSKALSDMPAGSRVEGLNVLLKQGSIEILKKGDKLIYRAKDPEKKSALPKDADNEEKVVYSIVEEGGNKGIWIRDIRMKSNLNMTQLNKILKNLETKKLIKAVKSVNASKKKVYMLYNLEADRSVTGGAWYQDQDFEVEFVDVLNQQCLRFLQMKREGAEKKRDGPLAFKQMSCCTVKEVHKFISDLGISKVNLDEDDLETILKTVVYDGSAERILQSDGTYVYRAVNLPLPAPGLVQMPCGICPVIKNCSNCGDVTAINCQYMNDWLD